MTRLTADDVGTLTRELAEFEVRLREAAGVDLRALALRAAGHDEGRAPFDGVRMAAVPVSSGIGFIPGFCECVVAILRHLGCSAWSTEQPDVRGIQSAVADGAEVLFLADDFRFVALNISSGCCVDDDPATADGYVAALDATAGGIAGRDVLLLGLGPVGRAAARQLANGGATVVVVEPDRTRLEAALAAGLEVEPVSLTAGLERCELVFDATPVADLIDIDGVTAATVAAVPGMPSAFTAAAQRVLGVRHIHEPLAIGVAVMAARALLPPLE